MVGSFRAFSSIYFAAGEGCLPEPVCMSLHILSSVSSLWTQYPGSLVGRWRNDKEHGVGIKYDAFERSVLVGEFEQGLPSGHGVKYYSDGSGWNIRQHPNLICGKERIFFWWQGEGLACVLRRLSQKEISNKLCQPLNPEQNLPVSPES